MADKITFPAEVQKVQTLADNGIRVTLDLPETCIDVMAMLAECKRQGIYLRFTAKQEKTDAEVAERPERKSAWSPP